MKIEKSYATIISLNALETNIKYKKKTTFHNITFYKY